MVEERLDEARLDGLFCLGVDEVPYEKRHQYLTVVADHDSGQVVWAAQGRTAASRTLVEAPGSLIDTVDGDQPCRRMLSRQRGTMQRLEQQTHTDTLALHPAVDADPGQQHRRDRKPGQPPHIPRRLNALTVFVGEFSGRLVAITNLNQWTERMRTLAGRLGITPLINNMLVIRDMESHAEQILANAYLAGLLGDGLGAISRAFCRPGSRGYQACALRLAGLSPNITIVGDHG